MNKVARAKTSATNFVMPPSVATSVDQANAARPSAQNAAMLSSKKEILAQIIISLAKRSRATIAVILVRTPKISVRLATPLAKTTVAKHRAAAIGVVTCVGLKVIAHFALNETIARNAQII